MSKIEESFNKLIDLAAQFDSELTNFYTMMTNHLQTCTVERSKSAEPLIRYVVDLMEFGPKMTIAATDIKKMSEILILFGSKQQPDMMKKVSDMVLKKVSEKKLHKDLECTCSKCCELKDDILSQVNIVHQKAIEEYKSKK